MVGGDVGKMGLGAGAREAAGQSALSGLSHGGPYEEARSVD